MLADALAGGHLIHDCGYLESGLTGSLVQLAICDELAGWINALMQARSTSPTRRSPSTSSMHTGSTGRTWRRTTRSAHYRERWYPTLIDRRGYEAWRAAGSTTLAERAAARVEDLLGTAVPSPLEPDVERAVRAVVDRAEATAGL